MFDGFHQSDGSNEFCSQIFETNIHTKLKKWFEQQDAQTYKTKEKQSGSICNVSVDLVK